MFSFFRRSDVPESRTPDAARNAVAERLRDPGITSHQRNLLRLIATQLAPTIIPTMISDFWRAKKRARS